MSVRVIRIVQEQSSLCLLSMELLVRAHMVYGVEWDSGECRGKGK